MPTVGDLEAVIGRLAWSWKHLKRFKNAVSDRSVGYHWVPLPKVESQSGSYVDYIVDEATRLPDNLQFIIGDCIHSLRASLDNLIYLLCPTPHAEFMICKTADQWKRDVWKIKSLPKGPCTVLYDLQPFHLKNGGDPELNPLWILNGLWNGDKHRAPHIAHGVTQLARIDTGESRADIWPIFSTGALDSGSKICRVWIFSEPEPELIPVFSFDIVFDSAGPARGFPVFDTLLNLHHRVRAVVEKFRPFFD